MSNVREYRMTPNEIYRLKPVRVTVNDEWSERTDPIANSTHLPELMHIEDLKDPRDKIEIRYYVEHCFDGRRTWELLGVFFDGAPVMLCTNSGRDNDEYQHRYITHPDNFMAMLVYLLSVNRNEIDDSDYINPKVDNPDVWDFYGSTIHDFRSIK